MDRLPKGSCPASQRIPPLGARGGLAPTVVAWTSEQQMRRGLRVKGQRRANKDRQDPTPAKGGRRCAVRLTLAERDLGIHLSGKRPE
jgi:hypothetical protein